MSLALTLVPGPTSATEPAPPQAGAFSPAGSLGEGRDGHTATLLHDGRVLVIGGGSESARRSVDVWDPATASFEAVGSVISGRKSHTATLLDDGRVLLVGDRRPSDAVETWDPATASSEPAGRLADARSRHTATLLDDGRVLIIGGWKRPGWLASAEVWDPVMAGSTPTGPLARARADHSATLLPDGRVLVVGGVGVDEPFMDASGRRVYPEVPREQAEMWDPELAAFTGAGEIAAGPSSLAPTLLPDGRVLIFDDGAAEVWDPGTGTSEPAGWLSDPHGGTATPLPDGRVLVVGTTSAEVWEPALGAFIPAGTLEANRHGHTATLLQDGRVLIIGGGGPGASSTAAVWEARALPPEQRQALATKSLTCGALRASFRPSGTTGDPRLDVEYLTECLTCDELLSLLQFQVVADMETGLDLYRDRCRSPVPATEQ